MYSEFLREYLFTIMSTQGAVYGVFLRCTLSITRVRLLEYQASMMQVIYFLRKENNRVSTASGDILTTERFRE